MDEHAPTPGSVYRRQRASRARQPLNSVAEVEEACDTLVLAVFAEMGIEPLYRKMLHQHYKEFVRLQVAQREQP